MEFLSQLWLGILLSACAVWFWGFLSNAVLQLHAKDFEGIPDEKRFAEALRSMGLKPGHYMFPFAAKGECNTPEYKEKWKTGPAGLMTVWTPVINMPRNMILTLVVNLVVAVFMAYVAHLALPHGGSFWEIWQVTGTLGVMAYSFAFLPGMIWYQTPARVMFTQGFDGVVQGLASGAVMAALWPAMAIPILHP